MPALLALPYFDRTGLFSLGRGDSDTMAARNRLVSVVQPARQEPKAGGRVDLPE